MPEMSNTDREIYDNDLKKAKAEVDAAVTIKDLEHAICREAALRSALNASVVPNLLYSGVSIAVDHMLRRLRELGWQQAVPVDQLGLKLADCAVLADLIHVMYRPLSQPLAMDEADQRIACKAVKHLRQALSNLDGAKLAQLTAEMERTREQCDDDYVLDNGQHYYIVYGAGKNQLTLAMAWAHETDKYALASRERFDSKVNAVLHARVLASRHRKTFVDPACTHDFLD